MRHNASRLILRLALGLALVLQPLGSVTAAGQASSAGSDTRVAAQAEEPVSAKLRTQVIESLGKLPLYFIENRGQLDEQVAYYVQGEEASVYFTAEGLTLALNDVPLESEVGSGRYVLKLEFVGAQRVVPVGEERQEAVFSYFKGQPQEWQVGLPSYGRVVYRELWPGIDLAFYGAQGKLKYEFVVQPGADAAQIELAYRGITGLLLGQGGELRIEVPGKVLSDEAPLAYQQARGRRQEVEVSYALAAGGQSYGFALGAYDPQLPLIIDPELVYCGYIGGAGSDYASGIAVDREGAAYVAGVTDSDETTFPVQVGPDRSYNTIDYGNDIFVAKLRPDGSGLVYSGYIGGEGAERAEGIAVDQEGAAYVAGTTWSDESSFPVLVGPDLSYNGSHGEYGGDVFVAKVRPDGSGLVYSGYIGGEEDDEAAGIAVDWEGAAYVTGDTWSDEKSFPLLVGPDLSYHEGVASDFGSFPCDAFVAKVRPDGSGLVYSGFIGGEENDWTSGIAVDREGAAYVVGDTWSDESSFPVLVGPGLSYNGGDCDAFVAKVRPDGSGLVYSGYIGGEGAERAEGIAVDQEGAAYVVGMTDSDETTFPVRVGPDLSYNGGGEYNGDTFVTKLRPDGSGLVYSGYIGGEGEDWARGIAVDSQGAAYVVGKTKSEHTFPVLVGPDLSYNGGDVYGGDAFIAKLRPDGSELAYSGYIGGEEDDDAAGIAVDWEGAAYVVGVTASNETSFPVLIGPDLSYNGGVDVFVAKVEAEGPVLYSLSGQVVDGDGVPVGGVTITANGDYRTSTASDGNYTLGGLPAGTYAVTPFKPGYRFNPQARSLSLPPQAEDVNFRVAAVQEGVTVEPFLDLPFGYDNFQQALLGNLGQVGPGRVNSWFDHQYPTYDNEPNSSQGHDLMLLYTGQSYGQLSQRVEKDGQGVWWYDGHNGIDFSRDALAAETQVLAAAPGVAFGVVRNCTSSSGKDCGNRFGNHVYIDHGNGYATVYAHLASVDAAIYDGAEVTDHQLLGIMGSTGDSDGVHLHFGLYLDVNADGHWTSDEVVDPYGWQGTEEDRWGVPSVAMWRASLSKRVGVGVEGISVVSATGMAAVEVPPAAVSTPLTLDIEEAPAPAPVRELRSVGRSLWLRILEWLSGENPMGGSIPSESVIIPASLRWDNRTVQSFAIPARLSVKYVASEVRHLDVSQLALYRWDESGQSWVKLASEVDVAGSSVTAQTAEVGFFDLQAPLICPAEVEEPDDSYYSAQQLMLDEPAARLLDISDDEDWFSFMAEGGESYVIETSGLAEGVDTMLELYDQGGVALLAENDDENEGSGASRLEWTAPVNGTYFARVLPGASSAIGCTASYTISWRKLSSSAASSPLGLGAMLGIVAGVLGLAGVLVVGLRRRNRPQVVRVCPSCGASVPPGAHYCPACGRRL